ncbi:Mis12-Mtw1 protein family-domain-containing protein [Cristinia sonorae]|uniref:Mis12-Mtw1 protein family-domain-containing protein n=1 Tax=Cristinia sonorae TaxID=1940300 RepID=A0A8K0XJM2_9AGAR|nr:Mis12-Mtw1 protein family-domain-containing protein [Cristinia sonorae]
MIPSHSQPSTSKRKPMDDGNPLGTMAKKAKKDASGKSGTTVKRKVIGEEQPGGLVIVRAPPTRTTPSQDSHPDPQPSRSSSTQPSQQHPPNSNASKPPSKKFKAASVEPEHDNSHPPPPTARKTEKGKEKAATASHPEPPRSTDARLTETIPGGHHRARPVAAEKPSILNAFQSPVNSTPQRGRIQDSSVPIPTSETPQIQKNKIMRGEMPHRRRSSISRGKRASSSFETTGVITQPHTSVADSSFYKHIDVDLPEPQRAQQLLIWCSHRALTAVTEDQTSSSRQSGRSAGKDPPPLSKDDLQLLKAVQEDVTLLLAEKKIDTNVFSPAGAFKEPQVLQENKQNVMNKEREKRFNEKIQSSKMEKEAWTQVDNFYKAHKAQVLADLERRQKELTQSVKGKARATMEDVAKWEIDEQDLPTHFQGNSGVGLARAVLANSKRGKSALDERIGDLGFMVDNLHMISHSVLEMTRTAESDLDRRFALLNLSLSSRSQPPPFAHSPATTPLSSYLPPSGNRVPSTTDPQDLLRALSRVDAERPQTQVGDAARRAAREVQRVADANGGMERRLTGVPPPTPRKPPGTPRRGTTPGKGR